MRKLCATIFATILAASAFAQPTCTISGAFTNRLGFPDTHPFVLISDRDPDFFSGGSFTRMPATVIFPNTNGIWSTNLTYGLYLATNAYLGEGILFRVPFAYQQPCAYRIDQLAVSGTFSQDFAAGSNINFQLSGETTTINATLDTNAMQSQLLMTRGSGNSILDTANTTFTGSAVFVGANYYVPSNHFNADIYVGGNEYLNGVLYVSGGQVDFFDTGSYIADLVTGGFVLDDTNNVLHPMTVVAGTAQVYGVTNLSFAQSGIVTNDSHGKEYTSPTIPASMVSGIVNYIGTNAPDGSETNLNATGTPVKLWPSGSISDVNTTNSGWLVGPAGVIARPQDFIVLTNAVFPGAPGQWVVFHHSQTNLTGWWIAANPNTTDGTLLGSLDIDTSGYALDPSNYLANAHIVDSAFWGSAPGMGQQVSGGVQTSITDSAGVGSFIAASATTVANSVFMGWGPGQNGLVFVKSFAIGSSAFPTLTGGSVNDVVLGYQSAVNSTQSTNNICIGTLAGCGTTGATNIVIGASAGTGLTTGNGNIIIGHPGKSTDYNIIRIGNLQTNTYMAGITTTTNGVGTFPTDTLSMTATGLTNSLLKDLQVLGFTGTSVTFYDNAKNSISMGTITNPQTITLQPGGALAGSSCAASGTKAF